MRRPIATIDIDRALATLTLPPGVCFDELTEELKETLRRRVVGSCGSGLQPVRCPRCRSSAAIVLRYFNNRRSPAQLQPRFRCTSCRSSSSFLEFYLNPASALTATPLLTRNSRLLFGRDLQGHPASPPPPLRIPPVPLKGKRSSTFKRTRSTSTIASTSSICSRRRRFISSCSSTSTDSSASSGDDFFDDVHEALSRSSPSVGGTNSWSLRRSSRRIHTITPQQPLPPAQQRPNTGQLRIPLAAAGREERRTFSSAAVGAVPRRRRTRGDRGHRPASSLSCHNDADVSSRSPPAAPPSAEAVVKQLRFCVSASSDDCCAVTRQQQHLPEVCRRLEQTVVHANSPSTEYDSSARAVELLLEDTEYLSKSTRVVLEDIDELVLHLPPAAEHEDGDLDDDDFFALPISHPSIVAALGPTHLIFSLS